MPANCERLSAGQTPSGTVHPRPMKRTVDKEQARKQAARNHESKPVLAYLAQHDNGLILFDTGIGDADPETEAHYRPRRRGLRAALSASGITVDDISMVVNCHLHQRRPPPRSPHSTGSPSPAHRAPHDDRSTGLDAHQPIRHPGRSRSSLFTTDGASLCSTTGHHCLCFRWRESSRPG